MARLPALLAAISLAILPSVAGARGGSSHSSSSSTRSRGSHHSSSSGHRSRGHVRSGSNHSSGSHHSTTPHAGSHKATGAQRDSHGKIKRDPEQRAKFMRTHPCPSTGKTSGACPGYVVDHKQALKHGGRDEPSNMQWQTSRDAKAKDEWE